MKVVFLLGFSVVAQTLSGYHIRVLIAERSISSDMTVKLSTQKKFLVSDALKPSRCDVIEKKTIMLCVHDAHIMVDGKRVLSSCLSVRVAEGDTLEFEGHAYHGEFFIVRAGDELLVINRVELETYVASGLRWEIFPSWPAAALEAGAIAYRTYVVAHVRERRAHYKKKQQSDMLWYDIHCTTKNQVYKGTHDCSSIHSAVKKTCGLILTYNKKPIHALYDICCGGNIPAQRTGVDFKHCPYLARTSACTFCKNFKGYRWTTSCTLSHLKHQLRDVLERKLPITQCVVKKKDASGYVHTVMVTQKQKQVCISGALLRRSLDLKSGDFTLKKDDHMLSISGKGYGHQLGLCQQGARACAEAHWSAQRILHFYYPGTVIMKIMGELSCRDIEDIS